MSVTFTEIANASAGLKNPRDLAFNPRRPDELWVVTNGDNGVTIVHDASADARTWEHRVDRYAIHFMANPTAMSFGADTTSFGAPGTFATCGESRNTYAGKSAANDFMGPVLWSSDLSIFAKKNPNGLGSHLDMLHQSPLCMGIVHQTANRYWTFGGESNSIGLYDFEADNGVGNDDHSDGQYFQYATGQLRYVAGVPSHLDLDPSDGTLYIADTGHARIAKLNTKTGKKGKPIPTKEPMSASFAMDATALADVVPASSGALQKPSGLKLHNGLLYVTDNATGIISAFTLDGAKVNELETGLPPGSLAGLAFGDDEKLYFVDMLANRVLRVDPR